MMPSITGRLLIASPYLSDDNFFRTVIYIVRHDAEGAFGVVVNRPGRVSLEELFANRIGHRPQRQDVVFLGGPVDGPLLALHTLAGMGEPCGVDQAVPAETLGDHPLWLTADEDQLAVLADRSDIPARFVARYSGWGPGQLDQELQQGGWLVGPADWQTVFQPADEMWELAVKQFGRNILADLFPQPPGDPQLN